MQMPEIFPTDNKNNRKLFFYDYIGIGLVVISILFFIQAVSFLAGQNFVAAIIGTVIGSLIFSAGIGIIKMSAIAKMTNEGMIKEEDERR